MSDLTPEQHETLKKAIETAMATSWTDEGEYEAAPKAIADRLTPLIAGWIDAERTGAFEAALFWRLKTAPLPAGWERTEAWGIECRHDAEVEVHEEDSEEDARHHARKGFADRGMGLSREVFGAVKRTVITGPWGSHND